MSGRWAFLPQFLEALPDPALVLDRRLAVISANADCRQLFPRIETGKPLSFGMRDPDLISAVESILAGGAPLAVELMERVPLERWFEAHVRPLAGLEEPMALIVLKETTAMRRADRMRVDFVANASHELRTPLASILGFIETLQGRAKDDPAARQTFLGIMAEQARRMSRLVDDLLSLSRIELNAHVRPTAPVDLAAITRETANALLTLAADRHVSIDIAKIAGPQTVPGDRDELIRVVENLIENAVKYGGSGGRIVVDVASSEREVILTVRDFGPGIAAEHLPRLTERFYRADIKSSREKGGTGLGLAIVKHIVARHRGRLTIESVVGAGATFKVMLPRAVQDQDRRFAT
jgi:two-component system, OmpR family, phosphate regulon sensor histidine kinase PhoR